MQISQSISLFDQKEIRKVWHDGQRYFVLEDVIFALTDSKDAKQYLKRMKLRDPELQKGWVQFVPTLAVSTVWWIQKMNCSNTEWLFRIIQSIPSPKAEPFKLWLAKVGYERIQEINNPELALNRSREYRQKHGRSEKWIQQRMTGQETRNKLTDYRQEHEVSRWDEFALLTNIIHEERTGLSVRKHKDLKWLKTQNLRDHMSEEELLFTALAELSTRKIAETDEAIWFEPNKKASKKWWTIAKNARVALESQTGKNIITEQNFLDPNKKRNLL